MTAPINTFQDILDAMERDPELRDALRRHILSDELLQLPAQVKALTSIVEALVMETKELRAGQDELRAGQDELRADITRIGGHVSNLMGTGYEGTAARYADRLARRHLGLKNPAVVARAEGPNATPPLPAGDQAAEAGRISWDEADDLALSDVIVAGFTEEGEDVFVVAEISITVQHKDRENATRRADILQRATGTPSIPVAIGVSQEPPVETPTLTFIVFDPRQSFAG